MSGEEMAESSTTCKFAKPGAFNGFLHCLLDQAWIQVVAAFFARGGVLPAVPLGKHPLPAPFPLSMGNLLRQRMGKDHGSPSRRQSLRMEAANSPRDAVSTPRAGFRAAGWAILAAFALPYLQLPALEISILHS